MESMFNKFCTEDGTLLDLAIVKEAMEKEYSYQPLPTRVHVTVEATTFEHSRGVEPCVHSKFSKTKRDKLISEDLLKEAMREAAMNDTESDEEDDEEDDGKQVVKPLNVAGLSKTVQLVVKDLEAQLRSTSARKGQHKTPDHLVDVCRIVGASKREGYEPVYLFHYYLWAGHEDEFRWQTAEEAGNISSLQLADQCQMLVGERIVVYWTARKAKAAAPYVGNITYYDEEQAMHAVEYEKDDWLSSGDEADTELLDLVTLSIAPIADKKKPEDNRESWILEGEHEI